MKIEILKYLLEILGISGSVSIGALTITALVIVYLKYNRRKKERKTNKISLKIKNLIQIGINGANEPAIINTAQKYNPPPGLRGKNLKDFVLNQLNNELELAKFELNIDHEEFVIKSRQTYRFMIVFLIVFALSSLASVLVYNKTNIETKVETQNPIIHAFKHMGIIPIKSFSFPEMVKIPGGIYRIGISEKTLDLLVAKNIAPRISFSNEMPQKEIKIAGFYMSKYEITVKQFNAYLKDTNQDTLNLEKRFSSDNQPAINISWIQAIAYCRWLSEKTGNQFRLPYEIEWEVAAKGNTDNLYAWGNSMPNQNNCNFQYSFINSTTANDKSPSNESVFHIFNMSGNVAEWCMDFYQADHYARLKDSIIRELPESQNRVIRGGGLQDDKFYLRCTARSFAPANTKSNNIGFRIVSSNNLTKIIEDQK